MTIATRGAWVTVPGGEVREYETPAGSPVVYRVALTADGEGRKAFRALYRIARMLARARDFRRPDPCDVAEALRMCEDKLRLSFSRP